MLEAFDTAIKISDILFSKIKEQKNIQEEFFLEFLSPLFNEYEKVAQNYLKFFQTFYAILKSDDWASSIENIKELRQEFRTQRVKLLASVDALRAQIVSLSQKRNRSKGEREAEILIFEFIHHVQMFFYGGITLSSTEIDDFPSIAGILDAQTRKEGKDPTGTHSRVFVEMFEFLALQDQQYENGKENYRNRKEELIKYTSKTIQHLEFCWHNVVMNYIQLELLLTGKEKALKKILGK